MKTVSLAVILIATALGAARADESAPRVFALDPVNISKAVVLMYKTPGSPTLLEVTFDKDKQAELAALATASGGAPVRIVLNGKEVSTRVLTPGSTGHSIKIEYKSAEEAFATARLLLAPPATPAAPPPSP